MDSSTGEVVAGPDVISRGFVYVRESENLMEDVKKANRRRIFVRIEDTDQKRKIENGTEEKF